jgi:hypothetical protein
VHLVDFADAAQVAERVLWLLGNPQERARRQADAVRLTREFAWDAAAARASGGVRPAGEFGAELERRSVMSVNRRPENAGGAPITVGLPFWNNERTLEAAIRSVQAQTIPDWVLLVVNDGSRDDSAAIVRSFRDPRIRLVDDGEHRGLVYRLNQIAALAASPFLARMDADDLMHPQRLERQLACLSGAGGPGPGGHRRLHHRPGWQAGSDGGARSLWRRLPGRR